MTRLKTRSSRPKQVDAAALAELAQSVDANGTLVSLPPAEWLVCFVPGMRREWWHRFAHPRHHHVFAMRPLDTDANAGRWLLVESWKHRLHVPVLPPSEAARFLRWASLGDILRVREHIPGRAWQTRGWSNCAVLTALVLGRRSWAWTPHGLYRELLRDSEPLPEDVRRSITDRANLYPH